ncbi:hypothetical protein VTK56DRAFT_4802 [Thermocarpiscus australiensis]
MPAIKAAKISGLVREKQRAVARESSLQTSLAELANFASSTTKQLDDAYYSSLEKLRELQSTIAALKELAEQAHQLNSSFNTEAEELVTDVSAQLDAFGQFEDQQKRIESLQGRIHAGRETIKALSERVDAVSDRIESWERADREWQEKTRKRLKVFWVVTSIVILVMLLLFIGAQYAPETAGEVTTRLPSDSSNAPSDAGREDESWRDKLRGNSKSTNDTALWGRHTVVDERLRAFDEL